MDRDYLGPVRPRTLLDRIPVNWEAKKYGANWRVTGHSGIEEFCREDVIVGYTTKEIAQLVAAAPEMYEALLVVKAFFSGLEENTLPGDPLREIRERVHGPIRKVIDASLAKADGVAA